MSSTETSTGLVGMLLTEVRPNGMALILEANEAASELLRRKPSQLCGRTIQEITYHEDAHLTANYIDRLASGEVKVMQFEKRYLAADGTFTWLAVSAVPVPRLDDADPLMLLSTLRPVEVVRREQALGRNHSAVRAELYRMLAVLHHGVDAVQGLNCLPTLRVQQMAAVLQCSAHLCDSVLEELAADEASSLVVDREGVA